eukprot:5118167-Pyramimonas_sp.AAC.1
MLLSIKTQKALGMVIDMVEGAADFQKLGLAEGERRALGREAYRFCHGGRTSPSSILPRPTYGTGGGVEHRLLVREGGPGGVSMLSG